MNKETINAVEFLMCTSVQGVEILSGGDLSDVFRARLADGRDVVVKRGPASRAEAFMLSAIAAAGAPAPEVLAVDDRVLVMRRVDGEASPGRAWADIGLSLSRLHAATGASYGWTTDYAFGPVEIVNRASDDWPAFWAEQRLLVFTPHMASGLAPRIERLCADLANRLPPRPAPALLHGDLWGGNLLTRDSRLTAFIDPACYHGHGEVDIAMLNLFDRPPPAFYEAYGGLDAGHEARRPIYMLWPALVHLRLFGASYAGLVDDLLRRAGF